MELHDHSHLRDVHRDEDVFVILSWSPSGASLEPFGQACTVQHSDVIMLLSERHLLDLWAWFCYGHGWLGSRTWWWMIWCHSIFSDLSHIWCHTEAYSLFGRDLYILRSYSWVIKTDRMHLMPYWGIFPSSNWRGDGFLQICYSFHHLTERYCICTIGHYPFDFHRDELSME